MTETWREYEKRFGKVDDELGRAFEKLTTETRKQAELLMNYSVAIDKGLAASIDKLRRSSKTWATAHMISRTRLTT